jgi:UDP-N-acetylglucosamine diphosphorylase / glucose-1-phosphate thymidylyltransferase / UDP-N-acetylgalactosamine diphosphorylase / glucosamine-1-phosphate N-acetyltransferase / galactosamine-1-phosphate N-acetyltransferase
MSNKLTGVIPAAGRGIRLSPHTARLPKSLLNVGGEPIIERQIKIMRDSLNIKDIYILVGYKARQITEYLKDGSSFNVTISYVKINDIEKGLANGILQLQKYIKNDFCVMLGDELYYKPNHQQLLSFLDKDFSAVCAIKEVKHPHIIKKNYAVDIRNNLIVKLTEKPQVVTNHYLGCGTYIFETTIFDYINITPASPRTKRVELTDVINLMASEGQKIYPFMLQGDYININNADDYNEANYILRSREFDNKRISLIIPAYNEELSIGYVIDDFRDNVDEILVVNNNSKDDTEKIAKNKGAKVLTSTFKGYGDALKFGMDNASGDIFILTEADGSFYARDLGKILEYLKDADMVLGTRTTKQMIEQAANMNFFLRWGNVVVAKLIELLWLYRYEPRLTDVGCTYRGIWKSVYYEIKGSLKGKGPEFSPEMIIEAIKHNKRIIEIPVTYTGRIGGESKFSKNLASNAKTALKMLALTFNKKFSDFLGWLKREDSSC